MKLGRKYAEFEKFVADYQPRLSSYARHFIRDDQEANDAVQNTLIKIWEKYREHESSTWPALAFTILRNSCINYVSRIKPNLPKSIDTDTIGDERLYSFDFGLENALTVYQELENRLKAIMETMSDRTREVFRLSRMEDKKNREIAELLEISLSAVEKHISKALKCVSRYNDEHN